MSILLQAAYKIVDIPEHSCNEIFKDYIFPSIITIITIWAAVALSKYEFSKNKKHELRSQEKEHEAIKALVLRNMRVISEQIQKDSERMHIAYLEGYDLKNGFVPKNSLFTFPELFTILNIDSVKLESVFIENYSDEEKLNEFYKTLGVLQGVQVTYSTLQEANKNLVNIFKEYDIKILKVYAGLTHQLLYKLLEFAGNDANKSLIDKKELKLISDNISSYKSEINNFYELKVCIDKIVKTKTFSYLSKEDLSLELKAQNFEILYLKMEQEVFLFKEAVSHLIVRLQVAKFQLDKFLKM